MQYSSSECPPFFQFYANYVEDDILTTLKEQLDDYVAYIRSIPEDKHLYRYDVNKWTIKEVVGHNTDTERLKASAALRIARQDLTPIPGFEENDYVANTDFNARSMADLLEEFIAVRMSTIALYKSLTEEELSRIGTASNKQVSSRVMFAFIAGHISHHIKILKDRYQVPCL